MANIAQDGFILTGPVAQSVLNMDLLSGVSSGGQDVSLWSFGSVQVNATAGISSGQVTFECSNDGVTYSVMPVQEQTIVTGALTSAAFSIAASTNRIFFFPIATRFIRVRISTAFVGGTVSAHAIFRQAEPSQLSLGVRNNTASQFLVTSSPATGTTHTLTAAASTNATSVKATAGALFTVTLTNLSATTKFFKLYAKASAPTVGTDIPIMTIPVAATSVAVQEFGVVGQQISTGIAYALTGLIADTDTTALAAGDMKVALTYI